MCGPSPQEEAVSAAQTSFMNELNQNYAANFGAQSAILKNLTSVLTPIVNAGPNQQGFSTEENAALNTKAIDTTAAATRNAQQTAGNQLAGRGDSQLESGVDQQIKGTIASQGAQSLANEELGITEANYATGRENFNTAVKDLGGTASEFNPGQIAGETNTAGQEAFGEANIENQQSQALGKDIAGAVTGGAEAFLGGFGKGVGG